MTADDTKRILVVDDDADQGRLIAGYLERQGFQTTRVHSAEGALQHIADEPCDTIVSDVRMPGMSGLEMLRELRKTDSQLPVLLVTAYADIRDAVAAMQDGAVNYLEKPIDFDELLDSVRHAVGLSVETAKPAAALPELPSGIVVASPVMRDLLQEVALAAPTDTRLLITGESGVGKEVIADLVHRWSRRARQACVTVNCAALPENLLESELFGHEKGAFTGAVDQRIGRFEEANGGTVFLDEIGEMSPVLQAKLLRVTQDGSFHRVGSNAEQHADVRIVAATNRDLEAAVAAGSFREDLFYRLSVIELHVPPLRERREEILPLARSFAAAFSDGQARLSNAVTAALSVYDWPGNIRELRNAMERAALMCRGKLILPEHLPRRIRDKTGMAEEDTAVGGRMEKVERAVILQTLAEQEYNRSETARVLGISRRSLIYKLNRFADEGHQIDPGRPSESRSPKRYPREDN